MRWIGIKKKPCAVITGSFYYGVIPCALLTRNRVLQDRQLVPDCGWHSESDEVEDYEEPLYDFVVGIKEHLGRPGDYLWREVEISDCKYGCKIYESERTGRRALAHNAAYGCGAEA